MYGPPVDLSFNEISSITDALSKVPRRGQRPLKTNSQGKYLSRSLHLSNNSITDVSNLQCVLSHFLVRPSSIGWLDLSFNKISSISPVLSELQELRVLYLHGNEIINLADVDKLGRLMNLQTITLHGNPIEYMQDYRNRVIFLLPHLKRMDFSAVTPQDHFLANVFGRRLKRKTRT